MINGVLHRIRKGVQWRDLPKRYGPWKTVHERHHRWSVYGTWELLLQQVQAEAEATGDIDWDITVDSTSVRATSLRTDDLEVGSSTIGPIELTLANVPGHSTRYAPWRSERTTSTPPQACCEWPPEAVTAMT